MKLAQKKSRVIKAYELGKGTQMEQNLIREGKIIATGDKYFLFSLEATDGHGEEAACGDFFKVSYFNHELYPYPNAREFFLANHVHLGGDDYRQVTKPLSVWFKGDSFEEPEIKFLIDNGKLTLNQQDPERYFRAVLWGAPLTAAEDAVLVCYKVERDGNKIINVDWGLVNRAIFDRDYDLLPLSLL